MFRNIGVTFAFMIIITIYVVDGKRDDEYYKMKYEEVFDEMPDPHSMKDLTVKEPKQEIDEIIYTKNKIRGLPLFKLKKSSFTDELNNKYNYSNTEVFFTSEIELKFSTKYWKVMGIENLKASIEIKIPVWCHLLRWTNTKSAFFSHGIYDSNMHEIKVKFSNEKCFSKSVVKEIKELIKKHTDYSEILGSMKTELLLLLKVHSAM